MFSRLLSFLSKTKSALLKLFAILIALPFIATFLHVKYSVHNIIAPQTPKDRGLSGQICFISASHFSIDSAEISVPDGGAEGINESIERRDEFALTPLNGIYIRQDENTFILSYIPKKTRWNYVKLPSAMTYFHKYRALVRNALLNNRRNINEVVAKLQYSPETQRFCLVLGNSILSCDSQNAIKTDFNDILPRTGQFGATWKPQSSQSMTARIQSRVYCPSAAAEKDTARGKRKRKAKKKKLLLFILQHPATSLLLAGQVVLALLYWNYSTPISTVAIIYSSIVSPPHYEIWRVYSGSFSHFTLLHLGFNMMTLHSLGTVLENNALDAPMSSLSSMEFLALNIALVALTTGTMMGIAYMQIQFARRHGRAQQEQQLLNTPVIGFSGVLFALMVVQTLDYAESCPIPFMFPDLCFATHTIPFVNIRWNISPLVSLVFTQLVIRNASFIGHLSGIICGYTFLHVGVLPFKLLVPPVLIPSILCWHYWWIQRIIPLGKVGDSNFDRNTADSEQCGGEDEEMHNSTGGNLLNPLFHIPYRTANASSSDVRQSDLCTQSNLSSGTLQNVKAFHLLRKLMLVLCVMSAFVLESDMVLAQCGAYILLYFSSRHYDFFLAPINTPGMKEQHKQALSTLLHGFFVVAVMILVTDSMTLGCWITPGGSIMWLSSPNPPKLFGRELEVFSLVVVIRLAGNITGLIATAKVLCDEGLVSKSGLFENVLGIVYRNAKSIGEYVLVPDLVPFEGRGFILGRPGVITPAPV